MSITVMSICRGVFNVCGVYSDTALFLFGRIVDLVVAFSLTQIHALQHARDRGCERGLAVIDVADCAYVYVGLVTFERELFASSSRRSRGEEFHVGACQLTEQELLVLLERKLKHGQFSVEQAEVHFIVLLVESSTYKSIRANTNKQNCYIKVICLLFFKFITDLVRYFAKSISDTIVFSFTLFLKIVSLNIVFSIFRLIFFFESKKYL